MPVMDDADTVIDEHLAKFPPFKGPIIGGNFQVDENVLSGQDLNTTSGSPLLAHAACLQRCQSLEPR
jgi:hypothetical protein